MTTDDIMITMAGERVALGPLRRDLFPLHAAWVNDPEVGWNIFGMPHPRTAEQEAAWLEAEMHDPTAAYFLIYNRDELRPVGVTSLIDIDVRCRTATFRILIGAAPDRGKGYGREATQLMLRYAFRDLGLRNVMLVVFGFNHTAHRLYERVGFRDIGRRRACLPRDGQWWDKIYMDCLASEFESEEIAPGDGEHECR